MMLVIEGRFEGMNEIVKAAKSHPQVYAKMKRDNTLAVAITASMQGLEPVACPVIIHFTYYEVNKRRDPDNFVAGAHKFILDGLVEAKVLPKDGWGEIAGFTDTWTVDKEKPRVEVVIEEVLTDGSV